MMCTRAGRFTFHFALGDSIEVFNCANFFASHEFAFVLSSPIETKCPEKFGLKFLHELGGINNKTLVPSPTDLRLFIIGLYLEHQSPPIDLNQG